MLAYFFESSALVKRYSRETGTAWIISLFRRSSGNRLYLAAITGVEVVAALTRQSRGGRLTRKQADKGISRFEREFVNRYSKLEIQSQLISNAMILAKKHGLRGYDAIQLSAALEIQSRRQRFGLSPLILVSADLELNNAAVAEGLTVENPNNHP